MSFFFSSDFPKAEKPFSVAIVHAEFNAPLVEKLLENTIKGLKKCGIAETAVEVVSVPGSLEIPFLAKKLLETGDFDGIIALGIIIRGETYHFEIVAEESARALMDLTLDGFAVGNGILTVENEAQAIVRATPDQLDKGGGAAKAAIAMMALKERFA